MLLKKFFNVGFEGIVLVEQRWFGLADLSRYPLFAPEFLEFIRKTMPPHRHDELVSSIAVTARKPAVPDWRPPPPPQRRTRSPLRRKI